MNLELPDLSYVADDYAALCVEIGEDYMGETGDLIREHARAVLVLRHMKAIFSDESR